MEHIWSPWRRAYIVGEKEEGCIFCRARDADDDKGVLVPYRGTHVFVILNKYPYNNGHFMVAPYRHLSDFTQLTEDEGRETFALVQHGVTVLREAMRPQGFNLGVNLGRVAGAGIEEHVHFHAVPRWNGDTNFMPVLGDVKVISEHLEQTLEVLKKGFDSFRWPAT